MKMSATEEEPDFSGSNETEILSGFMIDDVKETTSLLPKALPPFLQDVIDNQAVSEFVFYLLTILYSLVIFGSVVGNILVITAVLRSPNMRKVNNVLIVNLAVSDLLLCTMVSPVTLVEIMYKRWMGPKLQWVCRLSGMIPVCVTFVSTLTITGIAIDRYKVIVYSATNRTPPKLSTTILTLIAIWSISALLSSPLLFAMDLKVIPMPRPVMAIVGDTAIAYCAEEWGEYKRGRLAYSIFSLVVQFILPITLISLAHHAIQKKLRKLPSWRQQKQEENCKKKEKKNKKNILNWEKEKTKAEENILKSMMADEEGEVLTKRESQSQLNTVSATREVTNQEINQRAYSSCNSPDSLETLPEEPLLKTIFKMNWKRRLSQPFIVHNSVIKSPVQTEEDEDKNDAKSQQNSRLQEKLKRQARTHSLLVSIVVVFALSWFPLNTLNLILDIHDIFQNEKISRICFAFCHLIGMSSAFSNPILYGWFNEAFKEEFQNIGRSLLSGCRAGPTLRNAPDLLDVNLVVGQDGSSKRRRLLSIHNQDRTCIRMSPTGKKVTVVATVACEVIKTDEQIKSDNLTDKTTQV